MGVQVPSSAPETKNTLRGVFCFWCPVLPAAKIGRLWKFKLSEVDAWMRAGAAAHKWILGVVTMGFIDSYKHLDKLCGDLLNDDRRISAYIDEMLNHPRGSYLIRNWDSDLKKLKHYRWVRNKIVHEPGCSEENMCEQGDALWLDNFYSRIMDQRDPLALYYQATKPHKTSSPKQASQAHTYSRQTVNHNKRSHAPVGGITFLVCALMFVAVMFFVLRHI